MYEKCYVSVVLLLSHVYFCISYLLLLYSIVRQGVFLECSEINSYKI